MKFKKHTCDKMVELFNKKPFQGQVPEKASIVFLSSDANYSPEISNHSFFEYVREYQKDGVAFWKNYGCHHPFMLSCYPKGKDFNKNKNGVPFHRNFSKLGLEPKKYAEHISFLELLDIPTEGNKSENIEQFFQMVSLKHQHYIDKLIKDGGHKKLFFVSKGVLKDIIRIRKTYPCNDLFDWADFAVGSKNQFTKMINGNKIKEIYHFSSSKIHGQLPEIKSALDQWLGYN